MHFPLATWKSLICVNLKFFGTKIVWPLISFFVNHLKYHHLSSVDRGFSINAFFWFPCTCRNLLELYVSIKIITNAFFCSVNIYFSLSACIFILLQSFISVCLSIRLFTHPPTCPLIYLLSCYCLLCLRDRTLRSSPAGAQIWVWQMLLEVTS